MKNENHDLVELINQKIELLNQKIAQAQARVDYHLSQKKAFATALSILSNGAVEPEIQKPVERKFKSPDSQAAKLISLVTTLMTKHGRPVAAKEILSGAIKQNIFGSKKLAVIEQRFWNLLSLETKRSDAALVRVKRGTYGLKNG